MTVTIHHGNNLDILPTIPDNTFDAIITDPPYELGFMGKKWDASGIAYNVTLWAECLRVLKPGGHLLAFGGTRTYHRMTCAIEDAGFEIRDSIHWIYGSGFPKSLDVSKAIDKAAGAEREVLGVQERQGRSAGILGTPVAIVRDITAPATDAAKQWDGWGTALKPAHEPIVLARKPLPDTVANNVLTYRTGALNIDACRIQREPGDTSQAGHRTATFGTQNTTSGGDGSGGWEQNDLGRWPANIILDPDAAEELGPEARYFYCAKPSKAERNAGLENFPKRDWKSQGFRDNDSTHLSPRAGAGRTSANQNFHPTVKPLALMRHLIRLVTPPNGHILDPFAGSGTTLTAALLEGFHSTGIELTDDYIPIIKARTQWAAEQPPTLL
jgi:DNA modification methylase